MQHHKEHSSALVGVIKALVIGTLKVVALVVSFLLRVLAVILDKLATLLQDASGYGTHH